ncbi:uncharacterized protein LOC135923245 isoform X3 [Gordionus sp. m RMFG-2023]|uniref:uncharacterized protein LOC135923245 isoform X3 n=2 Tax=Gordionus sp. m RMFG-2023 TaxID=3053472 RepID=UPI0031FC3017
MPFLYKQVNLDPDIMYYHAESQTPTVTMPRIKALTTGRIPDFIDILYNFKARTYPEDNILKEIKDSLSIILFGDDTWIKLYPYIFDYNISHPLPSFDVSDYIKIDKDPEYFLFKILNQSHIHKRNWDVLITHFLGLDHAGHLYGPHHPTTELKLMEMDEMLKKVYLFLGKEVLNTSKTLLVVCGDHGMTDSGNHGGASQEEIWTPLIFSPFYNHELLSNRNSLYKNSSPSSQNKHDSKNDSSHAYKQRSMRQIDLVPTLAALFGCGIPSKSLGVIKLEVIEKFLFHNDENSGGVAGVKNNVLKMFAIKNLLQLGSLTEFVYDEKELTALTLEQVKARLTDMENLVGERMRSIHYDLVYMTCGLLIMLRIVFATNITFFPENISGYFQFARYVMAILAFFYALSMESYDHKLVAFSSLFIFVLLETGTKIFKPRSNMKGTKRHLKTQKSTCNIGALSLIHAFPIVRAFNFELLVIWICYLVPLSDFASSFIEEEHQIFYLLSVTCHVLLISQSYLANSRRNNLYTSIGLLSLTLLQRRWNRAGDKWYHIESLSDTLFNQINVYSFIPSLAMRRILVISSVILSAYLIAPASCSDQSVYGYYNRKWEKSICYLIFCLAFTGLIVFKIAFDMTDGEENRFIDNVNDYPLIDKYRAGAIVILLLFTNFVLNISIGMRNQSRKESCNCGKKQLWTGPLIYELGCCVRQLSVALAIFVTKPSQIPLIAMFSLHEALLEPFFPSTIDVHFNRGVYGAFFYFIVCGRTSFNYWGNSNKLSSLDLSPIAKSGYLFGPFLKRHLSILCDALTLIFSVYYGPIFWFLSLLIKIFGHDGNKSKLVTSLILHTSYVQNSVFITCLSATIQRHHIFVWSVFAPRLIFQTANLIMNFVGSIIFYIFVSNTKIRVE